VVVAGLICLDVIPTFKGGKRDWEELLVPGKLVQMGPAVVSTGGAVSNTGLSLHRLGVPVSLMGKVGKDPFGRAILDVLEKQGKDLSNGIRVAPDEQSSYTIVLSQPGVDRIFLHCPGCNDTFSAFDVDYGRLGDARLFHFGYPTIMRRFYRDAGEMISLLKQVRKKGLTVSMDMTKPDPLSESGKIAWVPWLKRVLPLVDVFLPSLDEILFMIDRPAFHRFEKGRRPDRELLRKTSEKLLNWGAALVALKLGDQGLYLRTTGDAQRLKSMGRCAQRNLWVWQNREMLAPCFKAKMIGTTGSGDSTIAGFLAGFIKGLPPEQVLTGAVATGACSVEKADAFSGVVSWEKVWKRVKAGWKRLPVRVSLPGFRWDATAGLYRGSSNFKAPGGLS
jgi:sugar/nucleoside kinase (ribokinase family)